MAKILWLPAAQRDSHPRSNPWAETTDPKGCLHTTETSGWPAYRDWTVMPHATVKPIPRHGVEVHQHLPFNQGSFALRNLSGGVQTNRDYVFQFELIGTSERGGPGVFWPEADDAVLLDLFKKVIKPVSDAYGIPLRALAFQSYPKSYGPRGDTNTVRLSGSAFDTYTGWLGHQHVPENVHGDPGAFPWARMIELDRQRAPKPPVVKPPPPQEESVTDISYNTVDRDRILAIYNRVAAPNLQLQTEEGVADALDEATDPLSIRFAALAAGQEAIKVTQAEIKTTLSEILLALDPPPAPPA